MNKTLKDNVTRVTSGNSKVADLALRLTDIYQLKIVQEYGPTTSHSDEETDNFYNHIDKIREKQIHYTIIGMRDFKSWRTNKHIRKGDRILWAVKWKGHSGRMGNIK